MVTGSFGGIGYATAGKLAAAGCTVVLHGIEKIHDGIATANRLVAERRAKIIYLRADLTVVDEIEFLMNEIAARFGGVDILVNNAVVRSFAPMERFAVADWDRALAANLSAVFHTIRLSVSGVRTRGFGRIVNMSSVYAILRSPTGSIT